MLKTIPKWSKTIQNLSKQSQKWERASLGSQVGPWDRDPRAHGPFGRMGPLDLGPWVPWALGDLYGRLGTHGPFGPGPLGTHGPMGHGPRGTSMKFKRRRLLTLPSREFKFKVTFLVC